MTSREMERPLLPRHLYEPSPLYATLFILYGIALFAGGGFLAAAVAEGAAPLAVKLVLVPVIVFVAANGGHVLGWVGHEGVHLNLHRSKYVSTLIGSFMSAMIGFPALGYGVAHWNHHRYTNQASDPDAAIYSRFRTFWARVLLARSAGTRRHIRNNINMALGRPLGLGYRLPFTARAQRVLAVLNLVFLVFWLGLYVALAVHAPRTALFAVGLPILVLFPITGLRGYVEHAGTEVGVLRDSRSYISPVYTCLLFGNNFHLEHHMYPGVPCYYLPTVHRLLEAQGYFERRRSPIETTVMGALNHTTMRSQYPEGTRAAPGHDPFVPAIIFGSPDTDLPVTRDRVGSEERPGWAPRPVA